MRSADEEQKGYPVCRSRPRRCFRASVIVRLAAVRVVTNRSKRRRRRVLERTYERSPDTPGFRSPDDCCFYSPPAVGVSWGPPPIRTSAALTLHAVGCNSGGDRASLPVSGSGCY